MLNLETKNDVNLMAIVAELIQAEGNAYVKAVNNKNAFLEDCYANGVNFTNFNQFAIYAVEDYASITTEEQEMLEQIYNELQNSYIEREV